MVTQSRPSDDAWLDELEARPAHPRLHGVLHGPLAGPLRMGRRGRAFAQTTPGKIIVVMVLLTALLLAAGLSMSQSMSSRNQALDTVREATEPMSAAAHLLSTSLLRADTIAAGGFVQPGPLSHEDVQAYSAALDTAVSSASEIYKGAVEADTATSERIEELVSEIQRDLPVYAGLNERARVNQRVGNPVGVAYMSEASSIMRTRMLVSASEINALTREDVAKEMRRLSEPQWVPLSGLVAALGFLVLTQWWLWRVFRRRLNKGFLAGTLAVAVALSWATVSNYQSWRNGSVEYERAAKPWEELTVARFDALQTRTDETFALLRRQSVVHSSRAFDGTYASVSAALATAEAYGGEQQLIDDARDALRTWAYEHNELVGALNSGSYEQAADLLVSGGGAGEAPFRELDATLSKLIASSREGTQAYIDASLDATRQVSAVVAFLSMLAVVCTWLGIRRRLGEYL